MRQRMLQRMLQLRHQYLIPPDQLDNVGYYGPHEPALRGAAGGAPPEFNEGSLRLRSLSAIWNDPAGFAYTRRFRSEQLGGECAGCPYGVVCRGGCTSMSVAAAGEPHRYPCCLWRLTGSEEPEGDGPPSGSGPSFG
jgi:radical SAM protein with 4Fe4S-binding SPASM domain